MVRAKDAGQPYDHEAFAARVCTAVVEVVRQQIDWGIDVVSDGEAGKPGFANYVKDRLTGIVARDGLPPRISSGTSSNIYTVRFANVSIAN
jgi:5-methyltetrahydropteroyltriglutamate--homocysteine methyltransferase